MGHGAEVSYREQCKDLQFQALLLLYDPDGQVEWRHICISDQLVLVNLNDAIQLWIDQNAGVV